MRGGVVSVPSQHGEVAGVTYLSLHTRMRSLCVEWEKEQDLDAHKREPSAVL